MSSELKCLAEDFFMAVWDLSERVASMPYELGGDNQSPLSPKNVLNAFKPKANPFLDLRGDQIDRELHADYDQIDSTIREQILPAFEVLQESWEASLGSVPDDATRRGFAEQCAYICNLLEMEVIPQASFIEHSLK